MKTLVVYSSRTGNTEKVARAIAEALGPECVLSRAEDAPPPDRFDFIAFGFGVYRGWPDGELRSYMRRARPRYAGIFLTLAEEPGRILITPKTVLPVQRECSPRQGFWYHLLATGP